MLGKKGQGIHVGKLERFLADFDGNMGLIREKLQPKTRGRVAVIGSGPAGLTIAGDLSRQGFNVEIFEMEPEPGGVLMFGIPEPITKQRSPFSITTSLRSRLPSLYRLTRRKNQMA